MTIEAIGALAPLDIPDNTIFTPQVQPAGGDFKTWFANQLAQVNDRLVNTDIQVQKLATGEAQNLHEVMINLEEARLSFQLMVQVRNRMLEAYQEVMRMQV